MIGPYLSLLFINCKGLAQTAEFNAVEVSNALDTKVKEILSLLALGSEEELVEYLFEREHGEIPDLLKTNPLLNIFYLINSLAEQSSRDKGDELRRSRYETSVQKKIGIEENFVLKLILSCVNENEVLKRSFRPVSHPSYVFLSHDIDSVFGSTVQDGLWAVKNLRFDVMFKLFANVILAKPDWLNIDQIMALESEYDFKSTFYWLVNKGRVDKRQTNADYSLSSKKILDLYKGVEEKGFENGLHKSISSDGFKSELSKLPGSVSGNRFHYLKFNLPDAYRQIEKSGLKLDASLGFAEHHGFRNSYGYPFSPYNFQSGTAFSFLEVPLNVMDGTFQRYLGLPVEKTAETAIAFFEKNKQNCLLSLLWHNTFFSNYKYKGYKEEYVKILMYLKESSFVNINQSGIIREFSWKKK